MEIIPKETPSLEHHPESTPFSYYLSNVDFHIAWGNIHGISSDFIRTKNYLRVSDSSTYLMITARSFMQYSFL
jgi:hypothetical protein